MNTIDGKVLKGMIESGANNLENHKKEVDALNVFPVPDGDTGTNMSLTFSNGRSEVNKSGAEDLNVIAKTFSRGLLMGARGNSGVILSQIFRGFYQSVKEKTQLNVADLSDAFLAGSAMAYKAVMRPVEGTILTVIRVSSEKAKEYANNHPSADINEYMEVLTKEAKAALDTTPDLLPTLKEAHVVDSGGCGLLRIFEGFLSYLKGTPIAKAEEGEDAVIGYFTLGYRVEARLALSKQGAHVFQDTKFRDALSKIGTDVTVIKDEDIIGFRVNTETPGEVLNIAQRYGEFDAVQIDNMSKEVKPSILDGKPVEKEMKEYGIISVSAGEGLAKIFTDYRADYVVSGGQTMNPSTEDFVSAIAKVNAKHIFILPNNSNIIMAARQAADVTKDKEVKVIETKSIPEGLSACIAFDIDSDVDTNVGLMEEAVSAVTTGQITYAIKDTVVDGKEIHAGDIMGLKGKEILHTGSDKVDVCCKLLSDMITEDSGIVTVIYGTDATEKDAEKVKKYLEENYDVDVDIENGGQPVYSFILGVE